MGLSAAIAPLYEVTSVAHRQVNGASLYAVSLAHVHRPEESRIER